MSVQIDWGAFLAALSESPSVAAACEKAGCTRAAAYLKRKSDPEFAEEWEAALQSGVERLASAVWKRAEEGWTPPPCKRCKGEGEDLGEKCRKCRGTGLDRSRDRPSDDLAKFLLRAHSPSVYGKTENVNVNMRTTIRLRIGGSAPAVEVPAEASAEIEPIEPSAG